MNMHNIVLINSSFNMIKPVNGQIDNQISLNTQIQPIADLKTVLHVHLQVNIKAHESAEQFGSLDETYFVPVEFDDGDILDTQVVTKAIVRQMIPLLSQDVNYFFGKACVPMMPPAVLLQILKNK